MLQNVSYLQLASGALMLIVVAIFAIVVGLHARRERMGASTGHRLRRSSSDLRGALLSELEHWFIDNQARLREFRVPTGASSDGSTGASSKNGEGSDWE